MRKPALAVVAALAALSFATPGADAKQPVRACGGEQDPTPYKMFARGASCQTAKAVVPKAVSHLQLGSGVRTIRYKGRSWRCSTTEKYLRICKRGGASVWANQAKVR